LVYMLLALPARTNYSGVLAANLQSWDRANVLAANMSASELHRRIISSLARFEVEEEIPECNYKTNSNTFNIEACFPVNAGLSRGSLINLTLQLT
jgi:hypothetical protein